MKCVHCGSEEFECREMRHSPSVKEEIIEVIIPTNVCRTCGAPQLSGEQVNLLRRSSIDQYRQKHHLLTSFNIIAYRESFGMSQSAFTQYLNVGLASLKRWETYYIQDASQDDHIRIKCDPLFAQNNLFLIQQMTEKPDDFNGMTKFSMGLFKNLSLFFLKHTDSERACIPNLLFYADFLNYKTDQKGITGNRYLNHRSGPCPYQWTLICKILEKTQQTSLVPGEEPDMSLFNDKETTNLHYVCDSQNNKKHCLIELSQHEKAFTDVDDHCFISYTHASSLLI